MWKPDGCHMLILTTEKGINPKNSVSYLLQQTAHFFLFLDFMYA